MHRKRPIDEIDSSGLSGDQGGAQAGQLAVASRRHDHLAVVAGMSESVRSQAAVLSYPS
ncbi:hypothetical protein [Nonomuraea sp. NPDC049309]|uniref:hypothetical protein n=1 Tax=Nonomuraea sp. NPDC049309 TaxID=3364350 RepID=UPI00372488E2